MWKTYKELSNRYSKISLEEERKLIAKAQNGCKEIDGGMRKTINQPFSPLSSLRLGYPIFVIFFVIHNCYILNMIFHFNAS